MLAALKLKRTQPPQGQYRNPVSPERNVLVPASSSPGMPSPDSRYPPVRSGIIPSSNLSRPSNNSASHGTPDGVMRSMMARKEEKANGAGSHGNDNERLPALSDLFDTPPSRSAGPRGHDNSSPGVPRPKTPSLVAAAQASQASSRDSSVDDYVSRLITQFPSVSRSEIMSLHRQYPNDKAKVSLAVRAAARRLANPTTWTSSSSLNSAMAASNLHVPVPRAQASPVKPRKNENSAIYNKRDKDSRKRRGSDSESEGQMSDAESEMDWSDEEGPRKRKKKNDDVIRPEKAALKAFNENTVEELTGTIGAFLLYHVSIN